MDGIVEYLPTAMMTEEERARHHLPKRDLSSLNAAVAAEAVAGASSSKKYEGQVAIEQDSFTLMEGDPEVWEW